MIILSEQATKTDPHSKRKLLFLTDSHYENDENVNFIEIKFTKIKLNKYHVILKMFLCRFVVSFFRYSGSTYHMAILSEAIYLVLLLKFPYYNELRGSKFCILITWSNFDNIKNHY